MNAYVSNENPEWVFSPVVGHLLTPGGDKGENENEINALWPQR